MGKEKRAVIVCTEYQEVTFGYTDDISGDTIVLTQCRNCIYWPAAIGGFEGLATEGPSSQCRIGTMVAAKQLRKVTTVTMVSPEAEAKWLAIEVYRG